VSIKPIVREGIAAAFRHFGGVPHTILGDNARALVVGRDRYGTVVFHPAYVAFCRDWDLQPRACAPYRARTKGKTEAGVKYVERNAIAGLRFASLAALEAHLAAWNGVADQQIHGTMREVPATGFAQAEAAALRALPAHPPPRATNGSVDASPPMRWSISIRFGTACPIGLLSRADPPAGYPYHVRGVSTSRGEGCGSEAS
jgi:hypothetical protein